MDLEGRPYCMEWYQRVESARTTEGMMNGDTSITEAFDIAHVLISLAFSQQTWFEQLASAELTS